MGTSFFSEKGLQSSIDLLSQEIQEIYLEDYIPWVVGFSVVMDAPFNNVDTMYGPRIADVVSKETPQVILMTNPQQWKGLIENTLREYVGAEYLIVKHSNSKKTKEGKNSSVVLPSGTRKLLEYTDGIQFSLIEEV